MLNLLVAATLASFLAPSQETAQDAPALALPVAAPSSLVVGPENFAAWGAFIRPSAEERKFEDIGWRNQFWPAVEEARALGRPLLLWTMNGHPLGCT